MTDDKVVILHPDQQASLESLDSEALTDRIVQLIRLADADGVPLCVVGVEGKESRRWASQAAFDNVAMKGALDEMKDGLKDNFIILLDEDFDEGEL